MVYVRGYEFDIFVSYAHVDNAAIEPADHGWVDAFVRVLDSDLSMKLGRKEAFSIWRDKQNLRGNHEISGSIPEQVRRSAVFLAIVSPGYVASKYCRQELQAFIDSARATAARRLFIINKDPIDESRHRMPECLRDLRKYQFWIPDRDQKPRVLGWPLPRHDHAEDRQCYYPKIGDLSSDIVCELEELDRSAGGGTSPVIETVGNRRDEVVLLAEVTDDLEFRRDEIRRYLEQIGIKTLPTSAYRLGRAEFEKSFSDDLDQCAAVVQLLGPNVGKCPPDVPVGFGRLQFEHARRRSIPILQWRSQDLNLAEVASPIQQELLQLATVQAMPFEEFKRSIVETVTRRPPDKPAPPAFLFVNAAPVDMDRAQLLLENLDDTLEWEMPLYEPGAKAEKIQSQIEPQLIDCDGLVILYGEAGPGWVMSQLQQYRKLAPRRSKEPRLLAIIHVPPETKTPIPLKLRGLTTFHLNEAAERIRNVFSSGRGVWSAPWSGQDDRVPPRGQESTPN